MGVGQEDRVEGCRVEPEGDPISDGLVGTALEHAAVDQDAGALGDEQELGAGDGRRPAEEVDLHGAIVPRDAWQGASIRGSVRFGPLAARRLAPVRP